MKAAAAAQEVIVAPFSVRDAVAEYMTKAKPAVQPVVHPNFRLLPLGGVTVEFSTGPDSLDHQARSAELALTEISSPSNAPNSNAFQTYALRL